MDYEIVKPTKNRGKSEKSLPMKKSKNELMPGLNQVIMKELKNEKTKVLLLKKFGNG